MLISGFLDILIIAVIAELGLFSMRKIENIEKYLEQSSEIKSLEAFKFAAKLIK